MSPMIKVPEFILLKAVKNALKFIRLNYEAQADKDKSYLRRVLAGASLERYDFVTQAEAVFMAGEDDPRYMDVDIMFNMQRDGAPTLHITLPSENIQMGGNGMGNDEGYISEIVVDETLNPDGSVDAREERIQVYTRRYQASYHIVITSDNNNEVILVYHTLRALLMSFTASLHFAGLENVVFGGQDVTQNTEYAGNTLYLRSIIVSLQYETSAPSVFNDPLFKSITAQGTPIN